MQNGPVKTIAKNCGFNLDHPFSSRLREGLGLLRPRKDDTNVAEAIVEDIHELFTNAGPDTYRLTKDAVVTNADIINQIHANRLEIFNSVEATNIMANQLNSKIVSKDYERCSERGAVWNTELLNRLKNVRDLRTDCVKSLLYPTQIFNDSMRHMESIHMRLMSLQNLSLRDNFQKQKEIQTLLESGQKYVSLRLSLLANFRDSNSYSKGDILQEKMIERVVHDYNELSDLSNNLYSASIVTGSPLPVSRFGRVELTTAIRKADKEKYNDQWRSRGAVPIGDTSNQNQISTNYCLPPML